MYFPVLKMKELHFSRQKWHLQPAIVVCVPWKTWGRSELFWAMSFTSIPCCVTWGRGAVFCPQQWQKQLSHWLHTPHRCFCWLFLSSNACWELWSLHKSKILLCFSMLKSFMYAWHEVCTRLNGPITTSWKDLFLNCCIFISKLLTRKPDNCSVWRRHPCL